MDAVTHALKSTIEAADRAITAEDFDALMDFYADDATLVVKPGLKVSGKPAIRRAFVAIAEHFNHSLQVGQGRMEVVEGGDTALVIMETSLSVANASGSRESFTRRATYVFRQVGERWLCVVDNSYGTGLLDGIDG